MSFYDWLLFLHVLSAFALVGALTAFWVLVFATRPVSPLLTQEAAGALARPANAIVIAGTIGTLVFGVWLAIDNDAYELWNGWIVASLVGWALSGWLGDQSGKAFTRAMDGALEHRRRGLNLHIGSSLVVLVVLVLMIFKPGA